MSERETADRNMAMAYYMKENRCFPPKTRLLDIMDLYFQVRVKKGPKILHFTTYTCTVLYSDLFHGGNDGIVSIIKILRSKSNSFDQKLIFSRLSVMGASLANGGICPPTAGTLA